MRAVPIEYIKENAILGDTIFSVEGVLLANKGVTLTSGLLQKIKDNQIYTLYIEDEHSNVEINRLVQPNLRNKAMLLIKNIFQSAGFRDSNGELKSKPIHGYMDEATRTINEVLKEIYEVQDAPLEYVNIKSVENYLYMSSLNCGILSAMMAIGLGYKEDMVRQIFMAGVIHDIGMALIPQSIFHKTEPFTRDEKLMILNHPKTGYEYLRDKHYINAYAKQATLQHHEKLDGSGYPSSIKGKDLTIISQIVGVADVFDAMTSDKPYSRAVTPNEALEFLMASSGRFFDSQLINLFAKKIHPYPKGSLVRLNNSKIAVVDEVPKDLPLRPRVRIIEGESGSYSYKAIDLLEERNLIIENIVYDV